MLDTNICIYVINDRPSAVRRIFNERAEQLCISSVSLAELHYGAARSADRRRYGVAGDGRYGRLTGAFLEKTGSSDGRFRIERQLNPQRTIQGRAFARRQAPDHRAEPVPGHGADLVGDST